MLQKEMLDKYKIKLQQEEIYIGLMTNYEDNPRDMYDGTWGNLSGK